jgi:hypothetical protein
VSVLEGLMERTARAYRENPHEMRENSHDMLILSNMYRWVAGEELVQAIDHATAVGVSSTMFEGNILAKIILDALMFLRHESNDRLMTTVGRDALSLDADYSFSGLKWISEQPGS